MPTGRQTTDPRNAGGNQNREVCDCDPNALWVSSGKACTMPVYMGERSVPADTFLLSACAFSVSTNLCMPVLDTTLPLTVYVQCSSAANVRPS